MTVKISQMTTVASTVSSDLVELSRAGTPNLTRSITVANLLLPITSDPRLTDKRTPKAVFSVLDYGAVGDGVTNDAAAIQAAGNAAMAVGGIVDMPTPSVGYRVATEVYWPAPAPPANGAAQAFEIRGNGRTRVICDTLGGASVFVWSGFNSIDVRDLMFVGRTGRLIDCYTTLNILSNNGVLVQDCTFKGVGAAGPGVISSNGSDLSCRDLGFWGCHCTGLGVVSGTLWSRLDLERVNFNDIAILDGSTAVSKVGTGANQGIPTAWVYAGTVGPVGGGFSQSTFRAVACWFDENAASAIRCLATGANQLYAALVEDCQAGTGSVLTNGQAAYEFQNIACLDVIRTTVRELFGGGSLQKDAISIVNVEQTVLDKFRCPTIATDANLIRADSACGTLTLKRMKKGVDYRTLTSAAAFTNDGTISLGVVGFSGLFTGAAGAVMNYAANGGPGVATVAGQIGFPVATNRRAGKLVVNPISNTLLGSCTITIYKNNVATGITVTVPSLSTALVSDLVNTADFAATNEYDFVLSETGAGAFTFSATIEFWTP